MTQNKEGNVIDLFHAGMYSICMGFRNPEEKRINLSNFKRPYPCPKGIGEHPLFSVANMGMVF